MHDRLKARFMEGLELVSLSELGRGTSRARSTWEAYKLGQRRITLDAARELADYLHGRAEQCNEVADALQAAVDQEQAQ